jgi:hypothetical protein
MVTERAADAVPVMLYVLRSAVADENRQPGIAVVSLALLVAIGDNRFGYDVLSK